MTLARMPMFASASRECGIFLGVYPDRTSALGGLRSSKPVDGSRVHEVGRSDGRVFCRGLRQGWTLRRQPGARAALASFEGEVRSPFLRLTHRTSNAKTPAAFAAGVLLFDVCIETFMFLADLAVTYSPKP